VVTQFNGDDIVAFLNSPKAQKQFLSVLDTIILAYPISGINIDIEPSGIEITDELRDNYVNFISFLRQHLNTTYDKVPLTIDMYASASSNEQIWDIPRLAPLVDHIIVMAYDYHRRSSVQAGPVAPIFGGEKSWDSDISHHLKEYVSLVPPDKLLLGIPFYGYEWQTTDRSAQSPTYPETGATATLDRVTKILDQKKQLQVQEYWNDQALSPYLSYVEDGKTYLIYYENPRSISYKLDLVNQLDLAGVAIWALGYEGEDRVLWDVINQKFR
jgi:spore germination protein YaaH